MPPTSPPLGSSMPLEHRLGGAADGLRAILHPSTHGVPLPWRARLAAEGWFSAWRADSRCARAIPVVAGRLAEAGGLGELPAEERALAHAALAWGQARAAETADLAQDLAAAGAAAGARLLLCKGAALHGLLYADPTQRPSADVDVFVPGEEVEGLHRALIARLFAPGPGTPERVAAYATTGDTSLLDLSYRSAAGMEVEVKADPIAIGAPPHRLAALAAGSRPSPLYPGLLVPSGASMVLQQACSLARRDGPDLLGYAELAGVLRRRAGEIDPEDVFALVAGDGVAGLIQAVLAATERLYPGTVPLALRRRPARECGALPRRIRGGATPRVGGPSRWASPGRWWAQALSTRRLGAYLGWLGRRAFPPPPLGVYAATRPGAWGALQRLRGWRHGI